MATWAGAKEGAWKVLAGLWALGFAAGLIGYWPALARQLSAGVTAAVGPRGLPGALISWGYPEGHVALLSAAIATLIYKVAYAAVSRRQGRPVSLVSLVVFPVCNALGEGFLLLACFDLAR